MRSMVSILILSLIISFGSSCNSIKIWEKESGKRNLGFKVSLPDGWYYKRNIGWDSFVGFIHGPNVILNFELSPDGYANNLTQSPSDSVYGIPWRQVVHIDTINGYFRRIVLPDNKGIGLTGIYLKNLQSGLSFNMYGNDLDVTNQELAAKAFRSIRIISKKK